MEWIWKKRNNLLRFLTVLLSVFLLGGPSHAGISSDSSGNNSRKFKFVFTLDGKKSFIAPQNVKIGGIKIGLQYRDKFRFGLGLYGLDKPLRVKATIHKGMTSEKTVNASLSFGYLSMFVEPIILKTRKWELSAPIQLGSGTARLSYIDSTNAMPQTILINEKKTGLLEVSVTTEYKVLRWLGLGAGVGYRQMLTPDDIIRKNFNGPIYLLKVKIYFGEIYKMIFKRGKGKQKEKEIEKSKS